MEDMGMNNVRRGFAYEREVKQHFVDDRWNCMRGAHSASGGVVKTDLIAYKAADVSGHIVGYLFDRHDYILKNSKSTKIPLPYLASKMEGKHFKHVYYDTISNIYWTV
ncbi:unnamed protein product, partial [marine sediment metagenome]